MAGKGRTGGKRHRGGNKRSALDRITNGSIRRLARRGGVKRISRAIYDDTRQVIHQFLDNVLRDTITYTEHAQRKTCTSMDVVFALKRQGRTIYGFWFKFNNWWIIFRVKIFTFLLLVKLVCLILINNSIFANLKFL